MTEDERLAEIQRRINECRRTHAIELDLSLLIFDEVPDDVFELVWLEKLNISGYWESKGELGRVHVFLVMEFNVPSSWKSKKKLERLPSQLQTLTSLSELDISNQSVKNLGDLRFVSQLKSLDCSSNQLNTLQDLKHVPNLQNLTCSFNQLSTLQGLEHVSQLQSLDCSSNQLNTLKGLEHVFQLKSLNCSDNPLSTLQGLEHVSQLQSLNCSCNLLNTLQGLEHVSQLRSLDCSSNQLSTLQGLEHVFQLQSLNCSNNPLSTLQGLEHVSQLQSLNCSSNQLRTLQSIEQLSQLQSLDCSYNQITHISLLVQQQVLDKKIINLKFYDNPIHRIPSVIFRSSSFYDCCDSLINYWQALEQGSTQIQQLKVQLLGNGRVGKTTLAYVLEHKQAPPENFESTHGIALKEIPFQLEGQDHPITLQLWDFGGQEIYHATHRLFLAKDCLYLLLWAEETDESEDETNHPVSYWLELINDLGGDSPVILVKNQIDRDRSDNLPERPEGLTNDLPGAKQIRDAVKISAMKYQRIPSLRGAVASIIEELQPRICLELPNSWLAVQAELDALRRQQQRTLHFEEFEKLCEQTGIEDAQWFADYLHQSGFIFYQADTFQNQLVLDQNWAIKAIYKLFDRNKTIRRRIEKAQGRISGDEFSEFWPNETESEHQIYASFMLNCGVCYEIERNSKKHFKDREFIIPALLPEKSPVCDSWGTERAEDWRLEVQYPFLHRSIIERLISKLDQKYHGSTWRSGIFCTTSDGQVLFQTQLEQAKTSNKGSLLFKLRGQVLERLLYELRKLISEASPHKRYQELLTRNGKTEPLPEFQEEYHMTEPTPVEAKKVKIFISYSHLDEVHKKELDKHLKALSHLFAIEAWNDRQLIAGDQVDKTIFEKLNAADVVLLLISPDFMASDYCFKKEMQSALKAYKENKNTLIPIIIRNTPTWFKHEIGQMVALPTDGKHLSKWDDPDDFWADVETGIAKRVEHLLN